MSPRRVSGYKPRSRRRTAKTAYKSISSSKCASLTHTRRTKGFARRASTGRKSRRSTGFRQYSSTQKGNAGAQSYCTVGYRPRKDMKLFVEKLVAGKQQYVYNGSLQTTSGIGVQSVNDLGALYSTADCNAMLGNVSADYTQKCFLEDGVAKYTLQNATNSTINMTLYDVVLRHDAGNSSYISPTYCWTNGDYNQTGGSTAIPTYVGSTPFQSQFFCQMFKVIKTTTIQLSSGEQHVHSVRRFVNSTLSASRLVTSAIYGLGGLTTYTMAVQWGQPEDNNSNTVSTGATQVDIVRDEVYTYYGLAGTITTVKTSNNLSTSSGVNYFVNEKTAAVIQNLIA